MDADRTVISLAEVEGLDETDPEQDPGRSWHPRADKAEAWTPEGDLRDLDDAQVAEHAEKPESDEQYDGVRRRRREGRLPGGAEDSDYSEPGEV